MVHPNSGAWLVSPDGSRVVTTNAGQWHHDDGGVLDRDKIVRGKRYGDNEHGILVEDPSGPYLAVDDFTGKHWKE